jgi:hypothetical protein
VVRIALLPPSGPLPRVRPIALGVEGLAIVPCGNAQYWRSGLTVAMFGAGLNGGCIDPS